MGSLRQWWSARRPLTVRQHLIAMVFWLVLAALVVHRLRTEEDLASEFFLLAVVLTNLAVLLVSYRNTLRREKRRSDPDGDAQGTSGAS